VRSSGAASDNRQPGGGRCRGNAQDQARIALGPRIPGQDDLSAELDHPFVQRSAHGTPQRGETATGQGVGRGSHSGIDVVTDRASGITEHAGQVEPVADAQRGADLVGVLGLQHLPAPV
jgi:hypothetical protein